MKRSIFILCVIITVFPALSNHLSAQTASEIFLAELTAGDGKITIGTPTKITTRKGYNNQPCFLPDSQSLLFSSELNKQTDIFQYTPANKKTSQITSTPESEYSPTPMPGGKQFSVIRLYITDGPRKGAQPLMAFPLKGGSPTLLHENGQKVGYHAWIDKNRVAMFILGEPHFLQITNLKSNKSFTVAKNIGLSLYKIPGKEAVSFTHYEDNKQGTIKAVDVKSGKLSTIIKMKSGSQYYTWTPNGTLLTAVGSTLYQFTPGKDKDWIMVTDLAPSGIKKLTRLAVSPNGKWLAVVSNL
jgi:hypothetical protein